MAEIITTLHPDGDGNTNLYPNIKKENIPSKSISTDKLDDNVLSLIGSLKPSGTDTSANILAFTSNKGIYVATDNGHWYYWNGSAYADGGVYLASVGFVTISSNTITNVDMAPINSIITIVTSLSNLPEGVTEGSLLTYNQYSKQTNSHGTTQILITPNNKLYTRIKWEMSQWSEWSLISTKETIRTIIDGNETYLDLNDAPINSIITYINPLINYSNLPVQSEGTLITFNGYSLTDKRGSSQIYISANNKLYFRINWGGVWNAWVELTNKKTLGIGYNTLYPNLNDIPNGCVVSYTLPLDVYSNLPVQCEGTLICCGGFTLNGNNGCMQIYISSNNEVYTRIKWGTWKNWILANKQYDELKIYDDYLYEKLDFNNKSSVWFGDSIIHGETIGGVVVQNPVVNQFSNYCNMSFINKAVGGARFYSTGTNTIMNQLLNNTQTDVDYIFIGCGINDCIGNVSIDNLQTAINEVLNYINENYNENVKVIFITPINYYKDNNINDRFHLFRNVITETIIKFNNNRFNVIQGDKFDFPNYYSDSTYKTLMSEDGLHPTQLGYSTAYLRGLIKALVL